MKFLVDRCAGPKLAQWLQSQAHDTLDASTLDPDPGDRALLERAVSDNRILITLDKDFGDLIYLHRQPHAGLIRLPDLRVPDRIALVQSIIINHSQALHNHSVITVTGGRIRISNQQST